MSEKEKKPRRNSARKLFTSPKKDKYNSQDAKDMFSKDVSSDVSSLSFSENDDERTTSGTTGGKSKSKLRRLSKSLSREFGKSPVGPVSGEDEEKNVGEEKEKKHKDEKKLKRLSRSLGMGSGSKDAEKGDKKDREVSEEESAPKEKKSKLRRMSRSISKDILRMSKPEEEADESREEMSLSKSKSRSTSRSRLPEVKPPEEAGEGSDKKKKRRGRSVSQRLSGAFGNLLHLGGKSGDGLAQIEQQASPPSLELAMNTTTTQTAKTPRGLTSSTPSSASTPPRSKSSAPTIRRRVSDSHVFILDKPIIDSDYTFTEGAGDDKWTEDMEEEYKKQKKTIALQLAREASDLLNIRKSASMSTLETESILREMRFSQSEVQGDDEDVTQSQDGQSTQQEQQKTPPKQQQEQQQPAPSKKQKDSKRRHSKSEKLQPIEPAPSEPEASLTRRKSKILDSFKKPKKSKKPDLEPEPEPEPEEEQKTENSDKYEDADATASAADDSNNGKITPPSLDMIRNAANANPKESLEPVDATYKFIVIGDSAVGKTNLIAKMTDPLSASNAYQPTISVEMYSKVFTVDNKRVCVNLWDTAGQERYKSITRQFYKGCQGVLLVYSITDVRSFLSVQTWLNELHDISDEAEVILVGNKSDLSKDRKVDAADSEEIAESLGLPFIETSALTGANVTKCAELLLARVHKKFYKATPENKNPAVVKLGDKEGSNVQEEEDGCPCG